MNYSIVVSPEKHLIRAKKKGSDCFIEGYYVQMGEAHCLFTGKMNSRKPFAAASPEFHEINPYTVLHCVGFRDENLDLIFERDIIYDNYNGDVFWIWWNQASLNFDFVPLELNEEHGFIEHFDKKKTLSDLSVVIPADFFLNTKIIGNASKMTSYEIKQLLLDINTQKQENNTMR